MSSFRVDLRSDTVTKPSEAMRRAMAEAEVGDDWYDDDPTVNLLQERCAEAVGKEAGAFVPDGHDGEPDRAPAALLRTRTPRRCSGRPARHERRGDDGRGARRHRLPDRRRRPSGLDRRRAGRPAPRAGRVLRRRGDRPPLGGGHGRRRRRPCDAPRGAPGRPQGRERCRRARAPRRGTHLQRSGGLRGGRCRDRRGGGHTHVLPLQGPRRPDRLGPVRAGRHGARGPAPEDPVRRCVASGRDRGRRRAHRPRGRAEATPRGPRASSSPRRRRRRGAPRLRGSRTG